MKSLEPRIQKLENRHSQEISPPRVVIVGVPPCADKHIVGATVGDKLFQRMAGETVDELTDRATAAWAEGLITVSLNSPCHDSGGSECREIGSSECRGFTPRPRPDFYRGNSGR